ncbi:OB-fold nucleic acid binding domain-containing protein, partial [Chloroflexota bacterium]
VEPIIAERNNGGEFKSIEDWCRRCDLQSVNKRVLESLIKAGALDSLGDRGTLLQNTNRILSQAQREQRLRLTGQATMFDLWGEEMPVPMSSLDLANGEVSIKEKLAWEKELMGVYLSEHPFSAFAGKIASGNTTLCGQIDAELAGQTVVIAGMLTSVHNLFTKDHHPFVSAVLEDLDGRVEVMVWPRVYENTRDMWQEGNILLVEGKVRLRDDRIQLSCDNVRRYPLETAKIEEAAIIESSDVPVVVEETNAGTISIESRRLVINITQTDDEESDIAYLHKLIDILKDFPGRDEVNLCVSNEEKVINLKLSNIVTNYCPELHQRLVVMVGEDGLKLETNT